MMQVLAQIRTQPTSPNILPLATPSAPLTPSFHPNSAPIPSHCRRRVLGFDHRRASPLGSCSSPLLHCRSPLFPQGESRRE